MSAGFAAIDFHRFHRETLPVLEGDGRGRGAGASAAPLGSLALRVRETGAAYTYTPGADGISIRAGDAEAATIVELSHAMWEGLVHDLESAPGLLYGGHASGARGDLMNFIRWEPALRALYTGRPIYDPDAVELIDRDGRPLDPKQSFTLADDDAAMSDFLEAAGYLLIRGVFSSAEVGAMQEDAETLRGRATEADQLSWWGADAEGNTRLCRVLNGATRPRLAELHDDERILRLGKLPRVELVVRQRGETDGVTVLWKQPGLTEGLGDLPWHRDCGMGGHAAMCPGVNCSIHLGPANPDAGDLRFLPGSWRASVAFAEADDTSVPTGISIDAQPGDVSLHYGDVVHGAPPPRSTQGPFRTSVLIGWGKPGAQHHRGETHYNDALFQAGNAVPEMTEIARRS